MKKLIFIVAIGFAGVMNANETKLTKTEETQEQQTKCVIVESDCGVGGGWFACAEVNATEGEVDNEVADELRQSLNEAFCGYGD